MHEQAPQRTCSPGPRSLRVISRHRRGTLVSVGFFEPPRPRPEPRPPQPHWIGPPDNVVGAVVAVNAVVTRSGRAAIALGALAAFPNGFEFEFDVRLRDRELSQSIHGAPPWLYGRLPGQQSAELPDELLRYGVEFSDGSKATSLEHPPFVSPGEEPDPASPVLVPRGGGGGEARWEQRCWVWPLPPAGRLAFVWEWPLADIPLTHFELDASVVREASERAVVLWDDGAPDSGTGHGGFVQVG